jgi:hypothetical protein
VKREWKEDSIPTDRGQEAEEKTEKILKFFNLATRKGQRYRFECENYEKAQEWARKQLSTTGEVFPRDVLSLEEEN